MELLSVNFHMAMVFVIIVVSFYFYTSAKVAMETTAIGIIIALILLFYLFPLPNAEMNYEDFLIGFTNPALVTLLCLLILGEALSRTGALDKLTNHVVAMTAGYRILALTIIFCTVLVISGFLNNIPVVVIFIPILINLCQKFRMRVGQHMMALSFISILGGMTTLIGSSTNLLVSSALINSGKEGFSFFSFTVPGLVMVAGGAFYIFCIMPFIMRHLGDLNSPSSHAERDMFFTQFQISGASVLAGKNANEDGEFTDLPEGVILQFVKRKEQVFKAPFKGLVLQKNDIMVVAVNQENFEIISNNKNLEMFSNIATGQDSEGIEQMRRAEVVVIPHSPMIKRSISTIRFFSRYNCVVLGIKRKREHIKEKIEDVKLEGGDVLLLQGSQDALLSLKRSRNMILMEHSLSDIATVSMVKRSFFIFAAVVLLAATGVLPIMITALLGVFLLLLLRIVSVSQAVSVLDSRIIMVIAASLALGMAMQITGGANAIASLMVDGMRNASSPLILSVFFLITALLSNVLSTKATAILFTPIAISIAEKLGVDYTAFAFAVVFAANCSFASPVGYQTNLLVMGPGGYEFKDFIKAGLPLLLICWGCFTFLSYFWFSL